MGSFSLQWTPSNLDPWNVATPIFRPLWKVSKIGKFNTSSPWNDTTPLIRTLWLVPRVARLNGVHCTYNYTVIMNQSSTCTPAYWWSASSSSADRYSYNQASPHEQLEQTILLLLTPLLSDTWTIGLLLRYRKSPYFTLSKTSLLLGHSSTNNNNNSHRLFATEVRFSQLASQCAKSVLYQEIATKSSELREQVLHGGICVSQKWVRNTVEPQCNS